MPDIDKEEAIDNALEPSKSKGSILINEGNDITQQIIEEKDPAKLEDLTKLFNMNQRKKDIARANRLSTLLELVDDEVIVRFTQYPESFDNEDLLNYMTRTQQAVTNVVQGVNQTPMIQINNQRNEIHINQSGLDRDARARVLDVVNSILNSNEDVVDVEVEEKKDA